MGDGVIVGTAGHIDHGKSALVEALTGHRVDRLVEERARGITIELNFAPLTLPNGVIAGMIDVPGHEDLIRTMVAGASGIDLVLLVIAADEGIRPQTLEHLAVVEELGIGRGIPVLTKADLVEPAWAELVSQEIAERLAGSPVRFEAPLVVSARSGQGIQALRERIAVCAVAVPVRPEDDFRLPIDRSFSIAGIGTVVTGTVWSGAVSAGDLLRLLPSEREVRVRSIEMYGHAADRSVPGARVALGLAGIDRDAIGRGDVLVGRALPWQPTRAVDAIVHLQAAAPRPLTSRTRVRVHHGTSEMLARVVSAAAVEPGGSAPIRLVLEAPLVCRGGDRFVIREVSPAATIGGGVVVDPLPPPRSRPSDEGIGALDLEVRLAALVRRRRNGVAVAELPILLGLPRAAVEHLTTGIKGVRGIGPHVVGAVRLAELQRTAVAAVEARHLAAPAAAGLALETLRGALKAPAWLVEAALAAEVRAGRLVVDLGVVRRPDFHPVDPRGDVDAERLVAIVVAGGLTAPNLKELERQSGGNDPLPALRMAAGSGRLRAVNQHWYVSAEALDEFALVLRELGAAGPIAVGAVRDRLGLTRKHLIPLLEWADAAGITVRRGDLREVVAPPA